MKLELVSPLWRARDNERAMMVRRVQRFRGQPSDAMIKREWPHRVALLDDKVKGTNYEPVHKFAATLSAAPRTDSLFYNDRHHVVFRFKTEDDARTFCDWFGGELLTD